jgi:5-oxoprolinase (ATP-hydrolysing)
MTTLWNIWIDRGGTFTDVVGRRPDGVIVSHKLLSENPERYDDAALQGIREIMGLDEATLLEKVPIDQIKMGTTVATNALLERSGDRTLLAITKGFGDALRIGYQNRPDLFKLHIELPELLHEAVVEVDERLSADGEIITPLEEAGVRRDLEYHFARGIRGLAIVFMHGYRYPEHEKRVADIARRIGFTQISMSHVVSPLMKLVGRGDTTVVDAYLSPILRRYVERVAAAAGQRRRHRPPADVHAIERRTYRCRPFSGQRCHLIRTGRRRGGHGENG